MIPTITFGDVVRSVVPNRNTRLNDAASGTASTPVIFMRDMVLPITHCDVVIVGAGICGVTAADALARRGARVIVVEKAPGPGWEQSGRAQGAIRVQGREAAELPLALESLEIWRSVAEYGNEFELRFGGNLYLCTTEDEVRYATELRDAGQLRRRAHPVARRGARDRARGDR